MRTPKLNKKMLKARCRMLGNRLYRGLLKEFEEDETCSVMLPAATFGIKGNVFYIKSNGKIESDSFGECEFEDE